MHIHVFYEVFQLLIIGKGEGIDVLLVELVLNLQQRADLQILLLKQTLDLWGNLIAYSCLIEVHKMLVSRLLQGVNSFYKFWRSQRVLNAFIRVLVLENRGCKVQPLIVFPSRLNR